MLLQKPVCLTEWFAAEKSSVSRKRAWMRCFQYQMMRIVQHGFLLLCRTPPENKHDRSVLLIQYLNSCICELFPADSSMGIRLMSTNSQNCIQEQHTLFRPFLKIAVIWNIASEIILQFLVDVFQRRRDCHLRLNRKTQSMRLSIPVIRILPQNNHLDIL